jgi:hypothetical protein
MACPTTALRPMLRNAAALGGKRIGGAAYAECYINSKEIGALTYGKYIFFIAG